MSYYTYDYKEGKVLNDKHKKKKNRAVIIILGILVFVLLVGGVFFSTYYLFIDKSANSYENGVKNIVTKINEVNKSVGVFNKDQSIDPDKIRKEMNSKIDALTGLKDKAQSLVPTEKYKQDNNNFINGLDKNILIYRQIAAIVDNPEGKDIEQAGQNLLQYRDECIQNYSSTHYKGFQIALTNECTTLIENTSNYVNAYIKLNRDKEITDTQKQSFVTSMDDIVSKFAPINIDFSTQLSQVRNSNGNIDDIIALVNKNKDSLDNLQQQFTNLTVPSNAVSCYKLFNKVIEDYSAYLQSFVYSANNEKLAGTGLTQSKLDEIYSSPTAKLKAVTSDYNSFAKAYNDFKQ